MSPLVVLAILGAAVLTGPTAFLVLWLTYLRTGDRTLRTISFAMLGLSFILLGNSASFILENFLRLHDARVAFVLMNEVFIASVMTGGFILRFAHEAAGVTIPSVRRTAFWIFTVLFFFLVISLPIFFVSGTLIDVRRGYLASTVYGTICQAYATFLFVAKRDRLAEVYRRTFPPIFIALLALGGVSVLNDIFHFGTTLGGSDFPFSPIFFIVMNIVIVVLCVKTLLRSDGGRRTGAIHLAFGFTEREREIAPLLIDGLTNEEIADKLFISPHTVKNHVTSIFRKAGVTTRFELLKRTALPE